MHLSKAFVDFPEEGKLIGRILAGYAELETDLMHCVAAGYDGDLDLVLRQMYARHGEKKRLELGRKLGCPVYRPLDLLDHFNEAVDSMDHCRLIRNQYAHSIFWNDNTGKLAFANIEELAKGEEEVVDLRGLERRYATVDLLSRQFGYFVHVSDMLIWVLNEGNRRAGRSAHAGILANRPGEMERPPFF